MKESEKGQKTENQFSWWLTNTENVKLVKYNSWSRALLNYWRQNKLLPGTTKYLMTIYLICFCRELVGWEKRLFSCFLTGIRSLGLGCFCTPWKWEHVLKLEIRTLLWNTKKLERKSDEKAISLMPEWREILLRYFRHSTFSGTRQSRLL